MSLLGGLFETRAIKSGEGTPASPSPFTVDYFSGGPPSLAGDFDLCWCSEFVEHVEQEFLPNVLAAFRRCRWVAMTHAVPGQTGHHHVNCQPRRYWLDAMERFGSDKPDLRFDNKIRELTSFFADTPFRVFQAEYVGGVVPVKPEGIERLPPAPPPPVHCEY